MLGAMKPHRLLALSALSLASALSWAQVTVEGAWARPTVPGQQGGGGFLTLRSPVADRLIGGSTPLAQRFELHTMTMKGDVMEMREVDGIDLPAGQKVELKPGGLHVMLVGLKQPLKVGTKVPVTLRFKNAGEVKTEFEVLLRAPAAAHPPK
jgi:periplasmic copper chaperone A